MPLGPEHAPGFAALAWQLVRDFGPAIKRWLRRSGDLAKAFREAQEEDRRREDERREFDRREEFERQVSDRMRDLKHLEHEVRNLRDWKHDVENARLTRTSSQELKRIEDEEEKTPT